MPKVTNPVTPGYVRIAREVLLEYLRTGYLSQAWMRSHKEAPHG